MLYRGQGRDRNLSIAVEAHGIDGHESTACLLHMWLPCDFEVADGWKAVHVHTRVLRQEGHKAAAVKLANLDLQDDGVSSTDPSHCHLLVRGCTTNGCTRVFHRVGTFGVSQHRREIKRINTEEKSHTHRNQLHHDLLVYCRLQTCPATSSSPTRGKHGALWEGGKQARAYECH